MCQFIETIAIKNKAIQHGNYHQQRLINTLRHFNSKVWIDLSKIHIPISVDNFLHKCRITYNLQKIEKIEFEKYVSKQINTVVLIENNEIEYNFKYANRQFLIDLLNKSKADEIIIVKNKLITDSTYSNICFYNEHNWITPSSPLLNGIMRTFLLEKKIIKEEKLTVFDIKNFSYFKFINAMNDFDNTTIYPIDIIKNLM